ncbi:MAG: ABC-2 family transporter protein [Candidatus Aenigmatarchaeota archaeon]
MRLGPYFAVVANCFKDQLAYRVNFVMSMITPFLNLAVMWFVWAAVYASSPTPTVGGYTFSAMVTYVSVAVVIRSYTWLNTEYKIEQEVKTGSIAASLIKPLSYPLWQFAGDTGGSATWLLTKLPIVVFAFLFLGISGPASPLFFISAFLGYLVNYFMVFLTAMWAFWTTGNVWGLRLSRQMIAEVVSGALMPLTLFPAWMQGVFSFLPFQAVFYAPLSIYMGIAAGNAVWGVLAVQLAWVGMLFAITYFAWRVSVKRVIVQGG